MRRLLWALAGIFVFAQAAFYLALLIWPAGSDLAALMLRLAAWEAVPALGLQLFLGVPVLIALVWMARLGLSRGLIVLGLACLGLQLGLMAWQIDMLQVVAHDALAPQAALRGLSLARWADAGLALAALIALRLAWRAEALRLDTTATG